MLASDVGTCTVPITTTAKPPPQSLRRHGVRRCAGIGAAFARWPPGARATAAATAAATATATAAGPLVVVQRMRVCCGAPSKRVVIAVLWVVRVAWACAGCALAGACTTAGVAASHEPTHALPVPA